MTRLLKIFYRTYSKNLKIELFENIWNILRFDWVDKRLKIIILRYIYEQVIKDFFLRTNLVKKEEYKIIDNSIGSKIRDLKNCIDESECKKIIQEEKDTKTKNKLQKIISFDIALKEKRTRVIETLIEKRILKLNYSNIIEALELDNNKYYIKLNELFKELQHGRNFEEIENDKLNKIIEKTKRLFSDLTQKWWSQEINFYKPSNSLHIVQNNQVICTSSNFVFKKRIECKNKYRYEYGDERGKIVSKKIFEIAEYWECLECKNECIDVDEMPCEEPNYYVDYKPICNSCLFRVCGRYVFEHEIQKDINKYEMREFLDEMKKIIL